MVKDQVVKNEIIEEKPPVKMRKLSVIIIVSLVTLSCSDTAVFDIYKPIAKTQWHKDSIISFDFNPIDTI